MSKKRYKSKNNKKITFIVLGIIILIVSTFLFFNFVAQNEFDSGNLGDWSVFSLNKQTNELVIIATVKPLTSVGFLGSHEMLNKGSSVLNNKGDCELVGWRWEPNNTAAGSGCTIQRGWFDNKTYTSNVVCSHTQRLYEHPTGGVGVIPGAWSEKFTPRFDGFKIYYDSDLKSGGSDNVNCEGSLIISLNGTETPECKVGDISCGTEDFYNIPGLSLWKCDKDTLKYELDSYTKGFCGVQCTKHSDCDTNQNCSYFRCVDKTLSSTINNTSSTGSSSSDTNSTNNNTNTNSTIVVNTPEEKSQINTIIYISIGIAVLVMIFVIVIVVMFAGKKGKRK